MRIINFILLLSLINFSYIFITCNNEENKIIFFDLDKKEDLIIKDIFINQYNDNFNLLIDTMGFVSGVFLSKKLSHDFMYGNMFSPVNSYRTFEGHKTELKYNNSTAYFPMVIFKVYNRINFYNKNKKYNGIIGLALNYTEEVLLDERYFFGEPKKYSIMHYLKNDLKIIDKNIFSIYKDKFILGDINISNFNNLNYCNIGDNIYDSYIYFFWNCDIQGIIINDTYNNYNNMNYYNDIKISLLFDSLLKDYLLSTNIKIANIILEQINNKFLEINVCDVGGSQIICNSSYYDKISNMYLKIFLNNKSFIELPFDLMIKSKTYEYFYLNIEINEFNIDKNQNIIKIGKNIFDYYYVLFDKENKRIGFQKLDKIKLSLDEKYHYININSKNNLNDNKFYLLRLLFSIVILISSLDIILLIYIQKRLEI